MKFSKNYYGISRYIASKHDWSTEDIVMAILDRYQLKDVFRQSKSGELCNLLKLWLKNAGLQMSIDKALEAYAPSSQLYVLICRQKGTCADDRRL